MITNVGHLSQCLMFIIFWVDSYPLRIFVPFRRNSPRWAIWFFFSWHFTFSYPRLYRRHLDMLLAWSSSKIKGPTIGEWHRHDHESASCWIDDQLKKDLLVALWNSVYVRKKIYFFFMGEVASLIGDACYPRWEAGWSESWSGGGKVSCLEEAARMHRARSNAIQMRSERRTRVNLCVTRSLRQWSRMNDKWLCRGQVALSIWMTARGKKEAEALFQEVVSNKENID